jgi:Holliday junction resolvase
MRNEKGVRAEWELRSILRDAGAIVVRGAGSHCLDLVAVWHTSVWAVEVKSTSRDSLNVGSGAYLKEQMGSMIELSFRVPSYYAVKFTQDWRWYAVTNPFTPLLRKSEGMTLEQTRGYR